MREPLKPEAPELGPADHIARGIGEGDNRIIEGAVHMSNTLWGYFSFPFSWSLSEVLPCICLHPVIFSSYQRWLCVDPSARARIGMRALASARQAPTMSQASVTSDVHEALDIGYDFTRRSPSTLKLASISLRSVFTSSDVRSSLFFVQSIPVESRILRAVARPTP